MSHPEWIIKGLYSLMTATLRSTKHLQFMSPNFEDNGTKKIPGSVRTFCADLLDIDETFEGSVVLQSCKDIYEDFYDQNLEIQISDKVQELEKSLFSSQKISNHFRKITRGKKRSHNDNDKEVWQKRSRQNHIINGQDSEDSERIESSDDESDLENKNVIEDIEEQIKVGVEVDPNVSESGSGSVSEDVTNVPKYPDEKSLMDVWKLPSGITVTEAIYGPTILHKSHPSNLEIIRVGANVRQPEWIQKNDWRYLQASIEYPECPLSTDVIDLFDTLLGTNSLTEYTEVLYDKKFNFRENKQLVFVIDVLLWFSKTVFNPTSAFHNPRSQESVLGSLLVHPIKGEAYLQASANQRLIRRDLKPEDDKPLGLKVNGIFQSSDIEFGMDHVRGFWSQRDLLNDAAAKFACGNFKIMRQLRTWFLHVHGQDVQLGESPRTSECDTNLVESRGVKEIKSPSFNFTLSSLKLKSYIGDTKTCSPK
ncbi:10641_t:CDS:10 [Funneliformis mosseae]|uniref:10641_t:CDS:1 n=1 Tax=Funneliformis mosseae TaxID=27381 RepID=A0A9N9EKS4_FUNMO|nr:10641_t:CDS:10 [Funneliformis mosseae]